VKPLQIARDVSLAPYSTMRLGGLSAFATAVESRNQVQAAHEWALAHNVPIRLIGSGSNIVWRDEGFDGLLVINKIKRFEVFEEDETNVYVTIGGGENWDSAVARTVELGLTGIEALSLIPGTAGATPIQNVGAYGQDISQTLVSVEAYDTQDKAFLTISASDCGFGYRTSRFKTTDNGRFMITAITLHLTKGNPMPPFYAALQQYFDKQQMTGFTPQTIREAVINIRMGKLPDPRVVANNGSFFANPVIADAEFVQINADHPGAPHWPATDGHIKLSAAWLIEQAGFKDLHDPETGMATWAAQPLVLVNEHAKTTADLLAFRQKIIEAVQTKFQVTLEQEPELLP
jgi:UDP-N-acetylmuramate dehydrogenase